MLPLDLICSTLSAAPGLVLHAPPGAGKTTRVPLALLDAPWLIGQRILLLEPRRLAARAAAARMAETLGESVGETVGYRIRFETKVGPRTRIEVVTEGILTRMLQEDAALPGVGLVIFDEFHERSLHADLGLALCLETRSVLRENLKILVMSATLDGVSVSRLLGGAEILSVEGRAFPVQTRFLGRPADPRRLLDAVAAAVFQALEEEPTGDILVFLPGAGEIRRVESLLSALREEVEVTPLYGDLPQAAQDRALRRSALQRRKVVLSTSIAETSLTIDGVRVVIDCGRMRVPRFDPASGMTRLETLPVSRAAADQRRGRAGRQSPGVCYRLWSEPEDRALTPFSTPEILEADLMPLALDLARWGLGAEQDLAWLDAPPAAALARAREVLRELGALDETGRLTRHGRAMNPLALHPRLAHMLLSARELGWSGLACDLAALLSERDILRGGRDADIRLRLEVLRRDSGSSPGVDPAALAGVRRVAKEWRRRLGGNGDGGESKDAGLLLAFAYPDRIARRRPGGEPRYALSGGRGAFFATAEPLSAEDWLVVAETDGNRREARIFRAAPVALADIKHHFASLVREEDVVAWDAREESVSARRQQKLLHLVIEDRPLTSATPEALVAAMIEGVRSLGIESLPWTAEALTFRRRVALLRALEPDGGGPDLSDEALLESLETWAGAALQGCMRRAHLARLDMEHLMRDHLSWAEARHLDAMAPTHVSVPSGSRIPVDYSGETPVLAVRLQEMFGCSDTPRIAGGKVPLLLHLLSPARRPVQVTQDLAGFWKTTYREVKADLKGRYPRHWWPDDPLQAEPTARVKRKS